MLVCFYSFKFQYKIRTGCFIIRGDKHLRKNLLNMHALKKQIIRANYAEKQSTYPKQLCNTYMFGKKRKLLRKL